MRLTHRRAAALALAALALASAPALQAAPSIATLQATVGPGFTITLRKGGQTVKKLPAGRYRIVVRDLSEIHNFRLTGPGVNRATSVPREGTVTWTVTLRKGAFTYVCDPHPQSMRGTFRVT
ncbi:MAG: hypothetical protein IT201_06795 [Thermoleophilia bacterium]|nr:hypothetical protein [Thermoleophilia bacterium]